MIAARGFEAGEVVSDLDFSGGTMDRPGLNRALGRVRDGTSGGIVVARVDRFARTLRGALDVLEELERAGGVLIECDGQGWDTTTSMGRFGRDLVLRIGQLYREQVSEQWEDARRKAIERGVHPVAYAPYGYTRERGQGLVPDPETADHVRSLFRLRSQHASWRELCEHLERNGVPSPRGGRWTITTVRQVVMNRVYMGEARTGSHVNASAHEPLVTRSVWNAAQLPHPGRIRRGTEGARLAGLVFCASCGGRLTPELPSERTRQWGVERGCGYYKCRSRYAGTNSGCTDRALARMDELDALVLDAYLKRYEQQFDDEPEPPETGHLRERLSLAEDAMQALIEDPLSLAALPSAKRAEVLGNAQAAVERARADLDTVEIAHETSVLNAWSLSDLFTPEDFREASIPEQRRLLSLGIARIDVIKGGRRELADRVQIVWADEDQVAQTGNARG
jgi:DNA invertase Pin-like site-specific DNA recombinase